jgi:uroporphyrinogen-III decarboxylase
MCQPSWGHVLLNTSLKPATFVMTGEGFAEGIIAMQRRYRFDGVLLNLYGQIDPELLRRARITEETNGQRVELPDGRVIACPWDDDPHSLGDPDPTPSIDATDPDELPDTLEIPDWQFEATRIVVARIGSTCGVHGSVGSPFDRFVFHFGLHEALAGLVTDPDRCLAALHRFAAQQFFYAKAQVDIGVDAISISSPFAGAGFISPAMYRRFVLPAERSLVEKLRAYSPGVRVYTHTCGRIRDRLELMADTGIDGIECLDPPPLGDTELADAKRRVGQRVFLKGSLDCVNVLLSCKDEATLEAYVRTMIRDGAPNGGYILSTACSIAPRVAPWIIEGLVPLAERYGTYPL